MFTGFTNISQIKCWSLSGVYPKLNTPELFCDNSECIHGSCMGEHCVCDFGWRGTACDQCGGRIRYIFFESIFIFCMNFSNSFFFFLFFCLE